MPTSTASGALAPSVPAFEGLYYPPARGYPPRIDSRNWTIVQRTGEQWWVFSRERGPTGATPRPAPDGSWNLHLVDGAIIPMNQTPDGAWHASGDALIRYDDVLYSRVLGRRAGPQVLASAEEPREGHERSQLEINGPAIALRSDKGCQLGVLVPDPTLNGEKKQPSPQSLPSPGKLGSRSFIAIEIERAPAGTGDASCHAVADPSRVTPYGHDMGGGFFYAQDNGQIAAIQLIGYMVAELFMASGRSPAEIETLMKANEKELEHQAE